jgi:hypothetical protein
MLTLLAIMRLLKTKILFLFIFSFLFLGSTISSELKTYRFTSGFISCVKRFDSESQNYTRAGVVDSALMNGASVIDGNNLNATYWSYMNCLNISMGVSSDVLTTIQTCPALDFTVGSKRYVAPSSVNGKSIGIAGKFWRCDNGRWSQSRGVIKVPGGAEVAAPEIVENKECSSKKLTINKCTFDLPKTKDGEIVEDFFGSYYGDRADGFSGSSIQKCENGSFTGVSTICEPDKCLEGDTVNWSTVNTYTGSGLGMDVTSWCEGVIDSDGYAVQKLEPVKMYPSIIMARARTEIRSGTGIFHCKSGQWIPDTQNSTCKIKLPQDLTCPSVIGGDLLKKYFCE